MRAFSSLKEIRILLLVICLFLLSPLPQVSAEGGRELPVVHEVPLPGALSLCNEPMPLADRNVLERLDREFTIVVWDRAQTFMWLKRAGRYFPYIEEQLKKAGMPDDLKYLAVAESSMLTHIRSSAGALGPWQFMKGTARSKGLRKDAGIDERRCFERSTMAALGYLSSLKEEFGSWTVAMAAYNCGEGRMRKAIKEQKAADYYRLDLPLETERYIFRIAAIKLIMEDPGRYGYVLPDKRIYRPMDVDRVDLNMKRSFHIGDVAQGLGIDFKTLRELNPQILGSILPTGKYTLRLPEGKGGKLRAVLKKLAKSGKQIAPKAGKYTASKAGGRWYRVKRGDTLDGIATRTGVPVHRIKKLNRIRGSLIKVGQKLRLQG